MELTFKKSENFKVFDTEIKDINKCFELIKSNDFSYIPVEKESGLKELDYNDILGVVSGKYISTVYKIIEVGDDKGNNNFQEIKSFSECCFFISKKCILLCGKSSLFSECLGILFKAAESFISARVFKTEEIKKIESEALEIKDVTFYEIASEQYKTIKFSGTMEDIFGFSDIDLDTAMIKSISGKFESPLGVFTVKYTNSGTVKVNKPKGRILDIATIYYFIDKIIK